MKRVFGIEIEQCARCAGRIKVIASIEVPELIARILAHRREQERRRFRSERARRKQASLFGFRMPRRRQFRRELLMDSENAGSAAARHNRARRARAAHFGVVGMNDGSSLILNLDRDMSEPISGLLESLNLTASRSARAA